MWLFAVMQSFKLMKSPNQKARIQITLLTHLELECPANTFSIDLFQYAVGDTNDDNCLSIQFLSATRATCSIINCDTFIETKRSQTLNVRPLKKSPLAAKGHAMSIKRKVIIQSAFDVEYTCVIERMVFVSESSEARMNIFGLLAKFGKFNILRNPLLFLTVFPGKCVELLRYLDKPVPYFSQDNSVELPQNITIAPYSTRVLSFKAKDVDKHLFRKTTKIRLHENVLDTGIYTSLVYCSHYESKYPLNLKNPNPNSITIKRGILGCTRLDCTQETTRMMSAFDNVAFTEFVEACDPEMNNDLHLCSTEPYVYSLTEIDSRNKLSGMTVWQYDLTTDFSIEVKSL